MSTAIKVMKRELKKIKHMQMDCLHESGYIKNEYKMKYNMLVRKAREFKGSIDWMEKMYNE